MVVYPTPTKWLTLVAAPDDFSQYSIFQSVKKGIKSDE